MANAVCKCGKALSWGNKTGLCRPCLYADADFHARRVAAISKAFAYNPELRTKHRAALAESNRRPERRERSSQLARELCLWELGQKGMTAEVRARQGQSFSQRHLADIPLAHRDEYRRLRKKYGAKTARALIKDHAEAVARRGFA